MTNRPASIIAERLGKLQAERLSAIAGGTRIYVPAQVDSPPTGGRDGFARLSKLLGRELAVLLVLHFGDSRLYVPTLRAAAVVDARTVRRLTRQGLSAPQIARKLGCSDRTVHAKRKAIGTTRENNPASKRNDEKPPGLPLDQ